MGLGPSIKMTTKHHYDCPITKRLLADEDIDLDGIILDGVSENNDAKLASAEATGKMAGERGWDGAVVAIDGWGNHHIDFVSCIGELGERDIPAIGLSYIGLQGRLVCTNEYVDTIVDFNKTTSGYETCIVGQNNLDDMDAYKAVGILKHKVRESSAFRNSSKAGSGSDYISDSLTREYYDIKKASLGNSTSIRNGELTLASGVADGLTAKYDRIREIHVEFINPSDHNIFVNSNLDFEPICIKRPGNTALGSGSTLQLRGITAMLNGVEENTGFQPANIGSSEGMLDEAVEFDVAGTAPRSDILLHIDFLFKEGEGRTAEGIIQAHSAADDIIEEIRKAMTDLEPSDSENFVHVRRPSKMKIGLIKISSGLGNMYDTSIRPLRPAGYLCSQQMRLRDNMPEFFTPCEVLDGVIHTLI